MWKDIPYFPNYEASDKGHIRNKVTQTVLKNSVPANKLGVPAVCLARDQEHVRLDVALVIAATFKNIDLFIQPKPWITYIDGNKYNNAVNNLEIELQVLDLPGEEWKPVPNWEDQYEISNLGRARRCVRVATYVDPKTGRERVRNYSPSLKRLTRRLTTKGQYCRTMSAKKNGTLHSLLVDKLVATAFVSNPNNLKYVRHIDGDLENNNAANLEWVESL